jgi:hypothetical protein
MKLLFNHSQAIALVQLELNLELESESCRVGAFFSLMPERARKLGCQFVISVPEPTALLGEEISHPSQRRKGVKDVFILQQHSSRP